MIVEDRVQAVLVAASALTALVPAARIRVPGGWQNIAVPYIQHRPVSVRPTETHDGLKALRIWEFYQVTVFAATYSAGRAIIEQVITALKGSHGTIYCQWRGGGIYLGRDSELNREEFSADFQVAEVA